jgi:hypothetical protein
MGCLFKVTYQYTLIMSRTLGIILIIIGAAMLVLNGFTFTRKKKVLDAGPLQLSVDKKETVVWPSYAGAIVLAGGIVLVAVGKKSR